MFNQEPEANLLQKAQEAARQSTCVRRRVGAVIARGTIILSEGFNGPELRLGDCAKAKCPRCLKGGNTGEGYDRCVCVHAEQRAIAAAAKSGTSLQGAQMYVNLRPCLSCVMLAIEAGITTIFYGEDWIFHDEELEVAYRAQTNLLSLFSSLQVKRSATSTIF